MCVPLPRRTGVVCSRLACSQARVIAHHVDAVHDRVPVRTDVVARPPHVREQGVRGVGRQQKPVSRCRHNATVATALGLHDQPVSQPTSATTAIQGSTQQTYKATSDPQTDAIIIATAATHDSISIKVLTGERLHTYGSVEMTMGRPVAATASAKAMKRALPNEYSPQLSYLTMSTPQDANVVASMTSWYRLPTLPEHTWQQSCEKCAV